VVGAGLAGLVAATNLRRAGRTVAVLEARPRVGGRVFNHDIGNGEATERGGTFVGPTQDRLLALSDRLGVERFPTFAEGENVYVDANGTRSTYSDTGPLGTAPPDPAIAADLAQVVVRLDQMSTEVPVDGPQNSSSAEEWDQQTLETWIRANSASPQFRRIVPVATRPIFGAEPRDLSLLFVLFYIAASGNETNPGTFERNFNTRDGAQMFRFVGGSQRVPLELARRLGEYRVVLRSPVKEIRQSRDAVHVHSERLDVVADRVVVAVPPPLAARIEYDPPLPADRDQLLQRLAQGTLTKVTAVYDEPFWRSDGLNGTAVSHDGPVNVTYDGSPPDGDPGVIFGFVGGDEARRFRTLSASARRAAALANLVKLFGAGAASPREYLETDWTASQWSRGGPTSIAGPGTLLAYGDLIRRPAGRIHWAGTETSTYWNGYMDGAIRSGERAAAEVLAEL